MPPELSRQLADAARGWADTHTDALADLSPGLYVATVATTSPLKVSWRNRQVAAYKLASYTPVVSDRVLCVVVDAQLIIVNKIG